MVMSFTEAKEICVCLAKARVPILLRGAHGIGKSQIPKYLKKVLGYETLIDKRLSQESEGGMLGIPRFHEEGYTTYTPTDWIWKASKEPCILFLDEIDRAEMQLKNGAFQLMDSRTINGTRMHNDTIIIGAINGGIHGKRYMVHPMDPAELSRYFIIDLEPTVNEWLKWAEEEGIHPNIISFIKKYPSYLQHDGEFKNDKVYPCRRSWERLSSVIEENKLDFIQDSKKIYNISICAVGFETATSFSSYCSNDNTIDLSAKALLSGKFESYKKLTNSQIMEAMLNLETYEKENELSDDDCKMIISFYLKCPDEYLNKMISIFSNSNLMKVFLTKINLKDGTEIIFQNWWRDRIGA